MNIKTVVCGKCNAEQEITVNAEGKVICAFCNNEITDLPEDFIAEEYLTSEDLTQDASDNADEEQIPVGESTTVEFSLTSDDVKEALYSSGKLKSRKKTAIVETVLIAFLLFVQIYNLINTYKSDENPLGGYIFIAVILFLIPLIWVFPAKQEQKYIRSIADGTPIKLTFFENLFEVLVMREDSVPTKVMLDSDLILKQTDNLLLILLPNSSLLVIPKRALGEKEEVILSILMSKAKEG